MLYQRHCSTLSKRTHQKLLCSKNTRAFEKARDGAQVLFPFCNNLFIIIALRLGSGMHTHNLMSFKSGLARSFVTFYNQMGIGPAHSKGADGNITSPVDPLRFLLWNNASHGFDQFHSNKWIEGFQMQMRRNKTTSSTKQHFEKRQNTGCRFCMTQKTLAASNDQWTLHTLVSINL